MFPGEYQLYGSARSYFTAKVENVLRFQGVPYVRIEKMPHDGSAIEERTGSGAIPALVTPEDWPLTDSTPIIKLLDSRFADRSVIPTTPVQRIGALLLEDWLDEWFMRVAMYTRWNFAESVEALVGSGASMQRLGKPWHAVTAEERSRLMPVVAASLERIATFRQRMTEEVALAYGTTPEQGEDIPIWWGAFLDHLAAHLEDHAYLLGDRPCVADFVISGGFAAHFGNDLWPRRFVEARQPAVLAWAEALWDCQASDARWLPEDVLPATWGPFFAAMEQHYLPYLLANRAALEQGAEFVEQDFGCGPVRTPPRAYQELSRMDLRDEILNLEPDALRAVRAAVPAGVLDAYLVPPLDVLPSLRGNKDTFPSPAGIGVLDA